MAYEIILPALGQTTNELVIVGWKRQEGDLIRKGDVLLEVETDKATVEVEAYTEGILQGIQYQAGETVLVGSILAWLVSEAEADISHVPGRSNPTATSTSASSSVSVVATPSESAQTEPETPIAAHTGNPPVHTGRPLVTPMARQLANKHGADLSFIQGTGAGGVIKARDVETYVSLTGASRPAVPLVPEEIAVCSVVASSTGSETAHPVANRTYPLSKMRRTIADRLTSSKQTIPHYYVAIHVNVTKLAELRDQLKQLRDRDVSYNSLIVRAICYALRKYPVLNASLHGNEITEHGNINIGLAVEVPDGLRVPVVRDADRLDLWALTDALKRVAVNARENQLSASELTGGTFTVTSLGMFGVDEFSAIINPPEAGILAVGAVADCPVIANGAIVPGKMLSLTLSVDHRIVDGALAGRFMQTVREELEEPLRLLTPII